MEKYYTYTVDGNEPSKNHVVIEKKEKAIYEVSLEFEKHNIVLWLVYKEDDNYEYVKLCTVTKSPNGNHNWVWYM